MSGSSTWKRTAAQEVDLRCRMVEGTFLEEAAQAVIDLLGEERAGRQVPISGASNVIRRMLHVTATLYELCAVTGLVPDMAALCSDASWRGLSRRLAKIGASPMPTGLVEGGEKGGLSDNLEYLQAVGYSGVGIEWSYRTNRPMISAIRPADLDITYLSDDPSAPARVAWKRERILEGSPYPVTVEDTWDVSDPAAPWFRVMQGGVDVTARVPALAGARDRLEGSGYWWRYSDGRAFIPVVIYGNPGRVMRGIAVTEACLDGVAYRTAAKSSMIDAGFATREVSNLTTGTDYDATKTPAQGTEQGNQGPGDVRRWRRVAEEDATDHWSWSAAVDPEVMLRTAQAQERDAVSQLGFPVEFTATGGEPLAWEVQAQERAIHRWYSVCRSADVVLLRRIAALCNRQLGTAFPETGYTVAYRDEVEQELQAAETPAQEPPKGAGGRRWRSD